MTEIQLITNIGLLVGFLSLRSVNTKRLATMLGSWFLANVAYFYVVFGLLGYDLHTAIFRTHWGTFPFYLLFPIYVILLALQLWRLPVGKWRMLIVLAVGVWIYVPGMYGLVVDMANMTGGDAEANMLASRSTTALFFSVLAPMLILSDGEQCLGRTLFRVSLGHMRKHGETLLVGLALFILISCTFNLIIKGEVVTPHFISTPSIFVRHILFTAFYFALVEQFLAIGLAKRVLDSFMPGEDSSIHEMWLYALLLVLLNYEWPAIYLVREFLFGLVAAYMYLRTGSLAYGIIIRSIFLAYF